MTIEERRGNNGGNEHKDQFPVGMRVLAVDDDKTCLRVLESLLQRCQYHVTTTTQAVAALKMLRENRNKFDLVISDVHMPDMDGFKLLELVGLEMDLPVIMLSGNGDTKLVMKGITHGACDYLLKPVRIEELKNIWQHVIRRKKFDSRDTNNSDNSEKPYHGTSEGGQGSTAAGHDHNGKFNRKRKDQDDDEDEESENGQENEDPSTQKKPRVVWTVDLHRKFVAAVNQLGIDKAVPKKILDLMNVERLTRENVASHLQKYRLYLKRISSVASHQANMMATLGSKDASYLRMGSFEGLGDFHALTGSGQLPNAALGSFPSGGMLGRLNTPAALGLRGLPSGMVPLGHVPNSNNSLNDLGKLQSAIVPGNQNGNLLKGMPTSMELDQLQQNKCISRMGEFSGDETTLFPIGSGFLNAGTAIGNSSNSFLNASNSSLLFQGHPQQAQNQGGLGNQSSVSIQSLNPGTFETGVGVSSQLPDHGRCNENWQGAVSLTGFSSNPLPLSDPFNHIGAIAPHTRSNQVDLSPTGLVTSSLQDSGRDAQDQASSSVRQDNIKVPNFGSISNRVGQSINHTVQPKREENLLFNSLNSSLPIPGGLHPFGQSLGQDKVVSNMKRDLPIINQSNTGTSFIMQQNGFEKSAMETSMGSKGEYCLDQTKPHNGVLSNSSGSLEDLMHAYAMVKQNFSAQTF